MSVKLVATAFLFRRNIVLDTENTVNKNLSTRLSGVDHFMEEEYGSNSQ